MSTIEHQVCSLELAKKLKELGVRQEGQCFWFDDGITPHVLYFPADPNQHIPDGFYAAYTVAELGVMLPDGCKSGRVINPSPPRPWRCELPPLIDPKGLQGAVREATEANARAKLLAIMLSSGHTTVEEVNKRLEKSDPH
jgi:hypothetical protein